MSEHTPGRIQLAKEFDGHIMTMDGLAVSDCCLDYSSLDHDQQVSNARRLVACWNACEGISTESLESAGNAFNGWKLASYAMNDAKSQRAELLAALEQIERLGREADGNLVDVRAMLGDIARAAIAKVKGGAA